MRFLFPRRTSDRQANRHIDSLAKGSLIRDALLHRWAMRLLIVLLGLGSAFGGLLSPFFQKEFVDRLLGEESLSATWVGLNWVSSIGLVQLLLFAFAFAVVGQGLALLANYTGIREGVFFQRRLSERLYRKTLSVRTEAMSGTTVGEVVSIYAVDVPGSSALIDQALPTGATVVFPILFAPLAVYWITGIPLWATVLVMAAIVGLKFTLATHQARFFFRFKELAAERTGYVNEWIQNIRLLRILGWTERYESKIFKKREEETRNRVAMVTNGQLMGSIGSSISFVINLIGVATLVSIRGAGVSAGELFALLWIFGVFLARPFRQMPWIFTFSFDAISSMKRVERFLSRSSEPVSMTEEMLISGSASASASDADFGQAVGLDVRGLNLQIGGQSVLRNIHFHVKAGEFVAIVGAVGSGKSLLVHSLVGETNAQFERFCFARGGRSIDALKLDLDQRRQFFAFVAQEGFVMSATLRENIAFRYGVSNEFDEQRLRSLRLAQFDITSQHDALPNGLDTEIGERGTNLSGGQRQRVSLARAHQFDRPVVLLDDCLSAVDVDTENRLIHDLIAGEWRDKTRILVTHRLSVLSHVDRILFMDGGEISDSGTFEELMQRSRKMREMILSSQKSESSQSRRERGAGVESEVVS